MSKKNDAGILTLKFPNIKLKILLSYIFLIKVLSKNQLLLLLKK